MVDDHSEIFAWIYSQSTSMLDQLTAWSNINTHTFNLAGLHTLSSAIAKSASILDAHICEVPLDNYDEISQHSGRQSRPLAPAIVMQKRAKALKQVLLVIHLDTVYRADSSFISCLPSEGNVLRGPGVADAKGGIVVMLKALEAFERSPMCREVGWKVILNTDEEIGSPGSTHLLCEAARQAHIGFVYEPCLPNGDFVGGRKGSGNFTLVVKGKASHAGRDYHQGRCANHAMAQCLIRLHQLTGKRAGLTVNCGKIEGGQALNVVADHAVLRFNMRVKEKDDMLFCLQEIQSIISAIQKEEGVELELSGGFSAPPKIVDKKTRQLFDGVMDCARDIGLSPSLQETGGVCDGNRLAAQGLPTVDTMGVQGGNLHSSDEYMLIDSLVSRVKLSTLLLLKWANKEWSL